MFSKTTHISERKHAHNHTLCHSSASYHDVTMRPNPYSSQGPQKLQSVPVLYIHYHTIIAHDEKINK